MHSSFLSFTLSVSRTKRENESAARLGPLTASFLVAIFFLFFSCWLETQWRHGPRRNTPDASPIAIRATALLQVDCIHSPYWTRCLTKDSFCRQRHPTVHCNLREVSSSKESIGSTFKNLAALLSAPTVQFHRVSHCVGHSAHPQTRGRRDDKFRVEDIPRNNTACRETNAYTSLTLTRAVVIVLLYLQSSPFSFSHGSLVFC